MRKNMGVREQEKLERVGGQKWCKYCTHVKFLKNFKIFKNLKEFVNEMCH